MAKLIIRKGAGEGNELVITEDRVVLGRRSSNDLQILDAKASRHHAEVVRQGSKFILRDLKSRNGTLVNDQRVTAEVELEFGDTISIGEGEIEFIDERSELPIDVKIEGYEMIQRIGTGGMGTVYKAKQVSMDRTVALKVLNPDYAEDSEFIERFVKEARAAGKLTHANLIHVHDVGKSNDYHYFSMEYVDGTTVRRKLRRKGKFSISNALSTVSQAAKALAYAHENNIIHRDVKPDNLMLTAEGVVKIADLGIARTAEEVTEDGGQRKVYGTPHYIAPEQALGKKVDARADIYSLGATLYHMISGSPPFGGSSPSEILKAHVQSTLPDIREKVSSVPEAVAKLIEKMLEKSPERRYQKMDEVVEDVTKILESEAGPIKEADAGLAEEQEAKEEAVREFKRKKKARFKRSTVASVVGSLLAVAFVVGGVYVVLTFFQGEGEGPQKTFGEAERLHVSGKLPEALKLYQEIAKKWPNSTQGANARIRATEIQNLLSSGTTTGAAAGPDEMLAQAAALRKAGKYEEAIDRYEELALTFPDAEPQITLAETAVEEIETFLSQKEETEARKALNEADTFALQHHDDPDACIQKYETVARDYGHTVSGRTARGRADGLRDQLADKERSRVKQQFNEVQAAVARMRAEGDYTGAKAALDEFCTRHPGTDAAVEASQKSRELSRFVESKYQDTEQGARAHMASKRFGEALHTADIFLEDFRYTATNARAERLKSEVQNAARDDFMTESEEPSNLAKEFEFAQALVQLRSLKRRYTGTEVLPFIQQRVEETERREELHREIVSRVNKGVGEAIQEGEKAPVLPFKLSGERSSSPIVSATMGKITAKIQHGRAEQAIPWKKLEPAQVYQIYSLFLPFEQCTRQQHQAMAEMCAALDLLDEADMHFEKLDE